MNEKCFKKEMNYSKLLKYEYLESYERMIWKIQKMESIDNNNNKSSIVTKKD